MAPGGGGGGGRALSVLCGSAKGHVRRGVLVSRWALSFVSLRDGVPPYRVGSKKQLQREMHRSVKANGQVSLPHFPVSAPARWGRGSLLWAGPRGGSGRDRGGAS